MQNLERRDATQMVVRAPAPRVLLTAHAVLRWAERALGIDIPCWLRSHARPEAGDGEALRALEALRPTDVAAWRTSLYLQVERTASLGFPTFAVVHRERRVRVVVRNLAVITVLPLEGRPFRAIAPERKGLQGRTSHARDHREAA